ncbi:MAG: helix-turn-helix domain-containing protein [Rhodospirillales bacterium]|nr:helix-turn-helix domain-containing protein [Rhodospirillales bacterium]
MAITDTSSFVAERPSSVPARRRPLVLEPLHAAQTCATCSARATSVCNAIEDKDLDRLASTAVSIIVQPGHGFIEEGDTAEHFFNVTSGTVKLFKLLPDGRRQITGFAGIGHFLGLAVSTSYSFSAEAVDPVRICRFSRSKLRVLLDDFPAMEKRLLEVASNELVAAQEQMLLLGRKTARERLASFLMARAGMQTHCGAETKPALREPVSLPMTRGDIADYLGLTIETVSRTLTRLKAERLIDVPNTTDVMLLDPRGLQSLATGLD